VTAPGPDRAALSALPRARWAAVFALLLALLGSAAWRAWVEFRRDGVIAAYFQRERWHERRFGHALECAGGAPVVLIGDSMTNGFRDFWPGGVPVVNMGIPGDFSWGVYLRLPTVVACAPERVFLMVGVNDVVERVPRAETEANLLRIVRALRRYRPATRVFVQSVLPTTARRGWWRSSDDINAEVRALNAFLRARAGDEGYLFVDVYPELTDADGRLRAELTYDGIHLGRGGYAIWFERLRPHLPASPAPAAASPEPPRR
jgi:lysophospholipase L1-like esterase